MNHEISDFCSFITVMNNKAIQLRKMAYETPVYERDPDVIRELIKDIQYMALLIANDK